MKHAPVLSVACHAETSTVVAGTELVSSQAVVAFWWVFRTLHSTRSPLNTSARDIRSPAACRLQYVESHNDDITEVRIRPPVTFPTRPGL